MLVLLQPNQLSRAFPDAVLELEICPVVAYNL